MKLSTVFTVIATSVATAQATSDHLGHAGSARHSRLAHRNSQSGNKPSVSFVKFRARSLIDLGHIYRVPRSKTVPQMELPLQVQAKA